MDVATDRLGLLVDQLDSSIEFSTERMAGLTASSSTTWPRPRCCATSGEPATSIDR
ncbi:MAG: hypothetical protein ACR2FF_00790 [Mycobacteriales bacterium]